MHISLRRLTPLDEDAFLAGAKLWDEKDLNWYAFDWKPGSQYREMLDAVEAGTKRSTIPAGRVPATMLYAFEDRSGAIVGRLHVRHELNEALTIRGGHVGYAVAPKYRGQGVGREILRQGLEFCSSLGLNRILLTCADTNIPSWKIIERFGGQLENKICDQDGVVVRRYWIDLRKITARSRVELV